MAKGKKYIIYKITNGTNFVYVGLSTQALSTRFRQHKMEARNDKCTITSKLCQKQPPSDLRALHRRLRDNSANFRIEKVKEMVGSYTQAHAEELKVKSKFEVR